MSAASLDHLVGGRQQRFRDGEAEGLGGLEVDDQFELGGLLHRQIGSFLAFENTAGIDANLVVFLTSSDRTPLARMLPSVIGSPAGDRGGLPMPARIPRRLGGRKDA